MRGSPKERYRRKTLLAADKLILPGVGAFGDAMDNLKKYVDKTVRFKGQVLKSRELNAGFFVPGRMAMTCCADDTQFIGYICKNPAAKRLRIGSWVTVTAKVKDEFMEVYNGRGPVLYATEIEAAEKPEQELVYFG